MASFLILFLNESLDPTSTLEQNALGLNVCRTFISSISLLSDLAGSKALLSRPLVLLH